MRRSPAPTRRVPAGPLCAGTALCCLLLLAGCAEAPVAGSGSTSTTRPVSPAPSPAVTGPSPTGPSPTGTPTASGEWSPPPAAREITVDVAGGTVTPSPTDVEVSLGDRLHLAVTSDAPDEVHVHGVDVTGSVGPGAPFHAEVAPTETGVFEVELHDSGVLLLRLLVR